MPLGSGTRLGPYEIIGAIGAGGMGAVYRARDSRLARDVAIKALPEDARLDPDRMARFSREAQALAALNHPHIGAIYGLEEVASHDSGASAQYLVLELIEGGTVADRLREGPLPLRQALTVARQVANALEAAHEQGLIHRDVKPANIALTRNGDAKLLDFGLAKAIAPPHDAPTAIGAATDAGIVLGTAAYMSPEQARGMPVDRRSDIWSFGCVVLEMLTGRQPFAGETVSDTVAAILGRDPELSRVPRDTPPRVVWLIRRCLEKDPRQRLHDIADARIELDEALSPRADSTGPVTSAPAARGRASVREAAAWTIAAIAIGAAAMFALGARRTSAPAAPMPTYRSAIVLPDTLRLWQPEGPAKAFAISPDGRRLAFVGSEASGRARLWVRAFDSGVAQALAGTEGASLPFWSGDSRSIGYLTQPQEQAFGTERELMRVDAEGGQPVKLASVYVHTTGTWNRDGVILFTPGGTSPIFRMAAAGGASSAVTTLNAAAGEVQHANPSFLPDGKHFLFCAIGGGRGATSPQGVYLAALDGSAPPRLLVPGSLSAQYSDGHLLFSRGTTLFAQPFDPDTLQLSGEPVPFPERILIGAGAGGGFGAAFSVSSTGVLVYAPAAAERSQLTWFDRAGRQLGTVGQPGDYAEVDLSPDGSRAATSQLEPAAPGRDIWIFDVARGIRERFTDDPGDDFAPVWSPHGDRLVFSSERRGAIDLYVKNAAGSEAESLLDVPGLTAGKFAATWSGDGENLLFVVGGRIIARSDIWVRPFAGNQKAYAFAEKPNVVETQPRLSPDGKWIAYTVNDTGSLEVYITRFPEGGGRIRVSTNGGQLPRWRRDGKEIYFLDADRMLTAAAVNSTPGGVTVGEVRPLFVVHARPVVRLDAYPYDVSGDGQRFLVNAVADRRTTEPLALLVNWTGALPR